MSSLFEASLTALLANVEDAQSSLGFFRDAIRVKAALPKALNWEGEQTYEKKLSVDFIKREAPSLRVVRNGLYITMIATFEEYLRDIIIIAVQRKASTANQYKDLGESFIKRHMDYSGRLLSMVHRPPAHLQGSIFLRCVIDSEHASLSQQTSK